MPPRASITGVHRRSLVALLVLLAALASQAAGCGAPALTPVEADHMRRELRDTLAKEVPDRATRDQHSRYLADVIASGALDRLDRSQVRASLGKGRACRTDICRGAGFGESDWYYEVGVATSDEVKQLPVLIIGFDHRDVGVRVWNLTTH